MAKSISTPIKDSTFADPISPLNASFAKSIAKRRNSKAYTYVLSALNIILALIVFAQSDIGASALSSLYQDSIVSGTARTNPINVPATEAAHRTAEPATATNAATVAAAALASVAAPTTSPVSPRATATTAPSAVAATTATAAGATQATEGGIFDTFWRKFTKNLFKPLLLFFYMGFAVTIMRVPFEFPQAVCQGLAEAVLKTFPV